jgi:homoserine dehydrogenase
MSSSKNIEVAVIGVGLVGAEFVTQLLTYIGRNSAASFSIPRYSGTNISLVSLSSSKRTLSIPPMTRLNAEWDWKTALKQATTPEFTLKSVIDDLASRVSRSAQKARDTIVVVVDNTASEEIASSYPDFLRAGVNVITPNKKGFSGSGKLYDEMEKACNATGSRWYGESTVGAGLPVVATLKDLVATGDEVTKIEGVFSGTLSYIFNNFSPPTPSSSPPSFSSIVTIARQKGYTEPHPADDLSGTDVARKLTILSRLIPSLRQSLPEGYASVATNSLVPEPLRSVQSGDEFVEKLPGFDEEFDRMRKEAEEKDEVVRYVGVIDVLQGKVEAKLERYPKTHPLAASLSGADNIVLFHTKRYGDRPLIVQGAGAGAEVTAMGVLADLLKFL